METKHKQSAKTCLNCKYFQSFYNMYDGDDKEPTNQGRCNYPEYISDEEEEKKQDIAGVDAQGCKDWEKIIWKQN